MKKLVVFFSVLVLFVSCGPDEAGVKESRPAKGNVFYGGVFRMNETEDFRTLFPQDINDIVSIHIAAQLYEGLVKLNPQDLTILPCIAEKWEVSEDAKTWTFHLHKGVVFHNDVCFPDGVGREVTARDFKYCMERLCTESPDNKLFQLTFQDRVVGADEYYQSTHQKKPLAEGVTGVKVVDDYTLQIELKYPYAGFLNVLATPGCWVYPREAYEKYGVEMRSKCVGTGPFVVKSIKESDHVILERNGKYWDFDEHGNQLPYLDGINCSFIKEKKSEMLEFKSGRLDMIFGLPIENIPLILGEFDKAKEAKVINYDLQVVPAMATFYYGFQNQGEIFNKKEVRQAFNYAIDREKIVTYTLQGQGIPGNHGIIPPSFKGYDFNSIKGYTYDPEKAKKLLADAGYPNGKGFPKVTLQTNSGGGDRNIQSAEVIQKMLKDNLNVDVDINVMPLGEHLDAIETGKTQFWRALWIADYPDPSIFLNILYGRLVPDDVDDRSYINTARYKSPAFDSVYSQALSEVNPEKRMELFRQADQIAMDDAAIMPVFYDEHYRLVQLNVRNFAANAMEWRDLYKTYIVPRMKK